MPPDSGVAFVVVQHLAPTHTSMAAEIFSRFTSMPVREAENGVLIEANHVYTSPSDQDVAMVNGRLQLSPRDPAVRISLPIDRFFSTMGPACGPRAIGIILSGTGSDGSEGAKVISAHGGAVLVQKPETAEYDGMPRSAIATGVANYVLAVAQMPKVIGSYAQHPYVAGPQQDATPDDQNSGILGVIQIIKTKRGHDFSGYKRGTLVRRIERRMGLLGILRHAEYAALLKTNAREVDALFKDLLIGVTDFFRDMEAWKALETQAITPLVSSKLPDEPIRIWIPGCSTGEEAYTMAMVLLDRLRRTHKHCPVQIFATDTNNEALEVGRVGRYPVGIAGKISPTRLRRYFDAAPERQYFTVKEELRKCVVFGDSAKS